MRRIQTEDKDLVFLFSERKERHIIYSAGWLLSGFGGAMYLQVKCHPSKEYQTQSPQRQCDRR